MQALSVASQELLGLGGGASGSPVRTRPPARIGDATPFSNVHPPLAFLQGEGQKPGPGAPAGHFARGPRAPLSACPLYLQDPPWPLRLQTFEQQSAFVLQAAPDGKHASVVEVVLVVEVLVVEVLVVELLVV